ncbi:hypothetical protein CLPU_21c00280 [Gottschalkia purinilytica]|uniref:Coat F domain-containing protein n=1 Tax=Gottschalkia purinilytica TaxID=1503 RepID=A0A0L0W7E2_GOTPU|nr:hypothetical protein [Gottschalkia purinilytica]KNF07210.1 hypothetical protein CLPU_21c00280 [Gottschalkia purinilytica]
MALQNTLNLSQISQIELQNLREIVSSHQLMGKKLNEYANQCEDAQIKQMFQQAAQEANTTAQSLIQSL